MKLRYCIPLAALAFIVTALTWTKLNHIRWSWNSQAVAAYKHDQSSYEKWELRFCEYEAIQPDGKMVPLVFSKDGTNIWGVKRGRYFPPRYGHVKFSFVTNIDFTIRRDK